MIFPLAWMILMSLSDHVTAQGTLYPYGPSERDRTPPNKNYNKYLMNLPFPINFMGRSSTQLRVSTRGEVKAHPVSLFRMFGQPAASFDLAANSQSQMFYRVSTDTALLDQLKLEIRSVFGASYQYFNPRLAMVVTWVDVTVPNGDDTTPVNTMQGVVVADVKQTFIILNYGDINWVGWDEFSDEPVKIFLRTETVGFGTGTSYLLPGSQKPNLKEQLRVGNSGTPFRWILRVDLCDTCVAVPKGVCLASTVEEDLTECFCADKYRGSLCHIDIRTVNECASNPCTRGSCQDEYDAFTCLCPAGYQGTLCEIQLTPGDSGPWSDWSDCSMTCDRGIRTRTRQCLADPCLDENTEYDSCLVAPCLPDPDELEHSVLILTGKSLLEVALSEEKLKNKIAEVVAAYCLFNTEKCCGWIDNIRLGTFSGPLTAENVRMVKGYPTSSSTGQVQIRVVVFMTAENMREACGAIAGRRKRHLDNHLVTYFHSEALQAALDDNRGQLNDDLGLCCYEAMTDYTKIPDVFWDLLLGTLIPITAIVLALIGYVIYRFVTFTELARKKVDVTKKTSATKSEEPTEATPSMTLLAAPQVQESQKAAAQGVALQYGPPIRIYPAYSWTTPL